MSAIKLSERFAEIVALHDRWPNRSFDGPDKIDERMNFRDLAWQERDTIISALRAQEANSDAVKATVEAEREACAKIADQLERLQGAPFSHGYWDACREISAAIRARSSAPPVPAPIDEAVERRAFQDWYEGSWQLLSSERTGWSAWLARARKE